MRLNISKISVILINESMIFCSKNREKWVYWGESTISISLILIIKYCFSLKNKETLLFEDKKEKRESKYVFFKSENKTNRTKDIKINANYI